MKDIKHCLSVRPGNCVGLTHSLGQFSIHPSATGDPVVECLTTNQKVLGMNPWVVQDSDSIKNAALEFFPVWIKFTPNSFHFLDYISTYIFNTLTQTWFDGKPQVQLCTVISFTVDLEILYHTVTGVDGPD